MNHILKLFTKEIEYIDKISFYSCLYHYFNQRTSTLDLIEKLKNVYNIHYKINHIKYFFKRIRKAKPNKY